MSLDAALYARLVRLAQQLRRRAEAGLADQELNPAQLSVLHLLHGGPQSQQDIAAALGTSASNVSQLLRKMAGRGLVTRSSRAATRATALTEAGRATLLRLQPQHEALLARQLAPLSEAERRLMLVWLDRLLEAPLPE